MAEQLNYQINIEGNAYESIGEVKKALKDANAELLAAQSNFGAYSKQAIAAANKVATFKDAIQEASETANLFDPGKRFQALSGALTSVAGGFAAVQGAIGLFGGESKELEKQLLKVQSALALSQGLSTIADSAKDFQRLGGIIKNTTAFQAAYNFIVKGTIKEKTDEKEAIDESNEIIAENTDKLNENTEAKKENNEATKDGTSEVKGQNTATKTLSTTQKLAAGASKLLRGALVSIGIGAITVAVGYLINNWDKLKKTIMNLIPAIGIVADFIGNVINTVTDFIGITSEAERKIAELISNNEKSIKATNRFLELNADKYDEYTQRKIKANLEFKEKQNEFLKDEELTEAQRTELIKQAREKANREIAKATKDRADALSKANKEEYDKIKKDNEDKLKQESDLQKQRADIQTAAQKIQIDAYRDTLTQRDKDILAAEDDFEKKKGELIKAGVTDFTYIQEQYRLKLLEINKKYDKEELDLENQKRDEREKRETDVQKILIDSYRSNLSEREKETLSAEDELERKKGELIKAGYYNFELIEEEHRLKLLEINKKYDDIDKERELEILTLNADTNEEKLNAELVALSNEYQAKYDLAVKNGEDLILLKQLFAAREAAINKKYAEEDKNNEQAKLQTKINFLNEAAAVAGALATLSGEQTQSNRAFTLAQIGIDTAAAISSLTRNSENNPTNAVTFGASGAAQFAAGLVRILANIKKAKDLLTSSSSISTTAPSTSRLSPVTPPLPQATLTQLNQASINALGNSAIRAYVVETDITASQQRIAAIKQRARFG